MRNSKSWEKASLISQLLKYSFFQGLERSFFNMNLERIEELWKTIQLETFSYIFSLHWKLFSVIALASWNSSVYII